MPMQHASSEVQPCSELSESVFARALLWIVLENDARQLGGAKCRNRLFIGGRCEVSVKPPVQT